MDDVRFDRTVHVAIGGPGNIRGINSTREAAECLLYRWPGLGGPKHLAARKACLNALGGMGTAAMARKAFEAAAKESDILLTADFGRMAGGSQVKQRDAMGELKDILAAERAKREGRK
jgi:hypothetical protein